MSNQATPESQIIHSLRSRSTGRRTSQRYTPYKTPRSRPLQVKTKGVLRTPVTKGDSRPVATTEQDKAGLNALLNKTWRVYRLSPLYDFSTTPAKLKKYARFLSAHMEAESMKGFAVGLDAEIAKNSTITVLKELKVNQGDPDSLHITVKGKPKPGKKDLPIVVEAFLLSVNKDNTAMTFVNDAFTYYPLLLVKGAKSLTQYLCSFLESEFDCYIKEMTFSPINLGWMVAMWSGFVPEKTRKPVELLFKVPDLCEGLSQISLTIDAQDCKDLWNCISDENDDEFHEDQVTAFMKSLEVHFYQHFKVSLTKLSLSQVATTIAQAGAEGKLKIFSTRHMKIVLQFLTQLSWEKFMEAVV